jgi:hypothetical protein
LNFGDGCPVLARDSGNYKPASLGFGAQRGGRQSELSGDHGEALRLVVIHNESRLRADVSLLDHENHEAHSCNDRASDIFSETPGKRGESGMPYNAGARRLVQARWRLPACFGLV